MVALTLVLVPNRPLVHLGIGRLAAITIAALAVLFEILWNLSLWLQERQRRTSTGARFPHRITEVLANISTWFAGDPTLVTPPTEHPLMAGSLLGEGNVESTGELQALRHELELEQRRREVAEALARERDRTISALSDALRGEGHSPSSQ